jgi:hypothetical protein
LRQQVAQRWQPDCGPGAVGRGLSAMSVLLNAECDHTKVGLPAQTFICNFRMVNYNGPAEESIMRIHIDQIKEGGISLSYSEPAEAFDVLAEMIANGECEFLDPIDTRLKAVRIGDIIKVDGKLRTAVRLSCDRCLGEFDAELTGDFSLTYTQNIYPDADDDAEEVELAEDDLGLIGFRGE